MHINRRSAVSSSPFLSIFVVGICIEKVSSINSKWRSWSVNISIATAVLPEDENRGLKSEKLGVVSAWLVAIFLFFRSVYKTSEQQGKSIHTLAQIKERKLLPHLHDNMSAYALPGFFPPIVSCSSSTHSRSDILSSSDCCDDSKLTSRKDKSSLDEAIFTSIAMPTQSPLAWASLPACMADPSDLQSSSTFAHERKPQNSDPVVTVRDARIDGVKLIQAVTGTSKPQQLSPRKTLRRRGSQTRSSESSMGSPQVSPQKLSKDSRRRSTPDIQYEDAVDFDLSISFNGRKYNASRSLLCIHQFRYSLIEEVEDRKRLHMKRRSSQLPDVPLDEEDVSIPEIPSLVDEVSHGCPNIGFWVRDFTMLQAMASSYSPVLELWLRDTISSIPQDSECLANFLWEPLGDEAFSDSSLRSCQSSFGALGSIQELDYNTADESDDGSIIQYPAQRS